MSTDFVLTNPMSAAVNGYTPFRGLQCAASCGTKLDDKNTDFTGITVATCASYPGYLGKGVCNECGKKITMETQQVSRVHSTTLHRWEECRTCQGLGYVMRQN